MCIGSNLTPFNFDFNILLLSHGADANMVIADYGTPLLAGIGLSQSHEIITLLFQYGADVDDREDGFLAPLLAAVCLESCYVITVL